MPGEPPDSDASSPSITRIYDYWLGGKDHFAVDRQQAAELARICPGVPDLATGSRQAAGRAVTWCAMQGIRQFLDLGCGLPGPEPVHETARAAGPGSRVAYVDTDPLAVAHAAIASSADRGVTALRADLRDTAAVLGSPAVRQVIDMSEPVAVIMAMVLHFMPAGQARSAAAAYAAAMAPGSYLVISVARNDDEALWQRIRDAYRAGDLYNHSREDIASFFAGLEMVPPGLVPARAWRGGWADVNLPQDGPACVLAGIARKPLP